MTLQRVARVVLPIYLASIYATLGVARDITNVLRDAGYLRLSVVIAFCLAAIAACGAIFRDAANRSLRVVAMIAGMACLYGAVVYPMESPEEKLHFIEYGLVALLAWTAMPARWIGFKRFAAAAVFTLAAGWTDEGIQALLPSRHYDLRDVGFNLTAGVMALTALALVRWARRQRAEVVPLASASGTTSIDRGGATRDP